MTQLPPLLLAGVALPMDEAEAPAAYEPGAFAPPDAPPPAAAETTPPPVKTEPPPPVKSEPPPAMRTEPVPAVQPAALAAAPTVTPPAQPPAAAAEMAQSADKENEVSAAACVLTLWQISPHDICHHDVVATMQRFRVELLNESLTKSLTKCPSSQGPADMAIG